MMDQTVVNWALAIAGALGGWWMNAMWGSLKDLRTDDKALAERVNAIEVLVAGEYVKWDGLRDVMRPIAEQLLRIEQKLDSKADK